MENNNAREGNSVFQGQHAQNMSDDLPFDRVPLPSKGILYAEGSALHNCEGVEYKMMTAQEEDILASQALIKKGTVLDELLKSCLVDKRINVSEMIAGDKNAVMIGIRASGYGNEYNTEIECAACGHKYENVFDLSQLPIKRLDIEPVRHGENLFEFTLPMSGKNVKFKFLTGKDDEEISKTQAKLKKLFPDKETGMTLFLKHSIVEYDGISDKAAIARIVDKMPARDAKALRKYMNDHAPGVVMKQEVKCPACFDESEVVMPLKHTLFWPD